jgi:ppGpp synthetase/RelA/SpoT-type nucleotidyltranferase
VAVVLLRPRSASARGPKLIDDDELLDYYTALEATYDKVLEDVRWQLDQWLAGHDDAARIVNSSRVSIRVKPYDSVLRKARRDNITNLDRIPFDIEDLLGIRVSAPTKKDARELFEIFQHNSEGWFCSSQEEPKFVPYTIEDRNKYSLRSGYQAFHVTFVHERGYEPATAVDRWPVEIQIMSQLWNFWADYSRTYFYTGTGPIDSELLPYNTAISKILDSADDLMTVTADLLQADRPETEPVEEGTAPDVDATREWLQSRLGALFGVRARIPNDLFLTKIADDLALYGVSLERLDELLRDDEIDNRYQRLLNESAVLFLPPYQRILCVILLSLGWDDERVVPRLNEALWPQGVRLRIPARPPSFPISNEEAAGESA